MEKETNINLIKILFTKFKWKKQFNKLDINNIFFRLENKLIPFINDEN